MAPVPLTKKPKSNNDFIIPCQPNTFGITGNSNHASTMAENDESGDVKKTSVVENVKNAENVGNDHENEDEENVFDRHMQDSNHEYASQTIPIHQIGRAMLMGMGWQEGRPYGRSDRVIEPVDVKLMPKLAGLGSITTTTTVEEEQQNEKNEKNEKKAAQRKKSGEEDNSSSGGGGGGGDMVKKKATEKTGSSRMRPPEEITWVIPGIRVRIVSETYHDGKYYNVKGVVEDVPDPYTCIVSVESKGRRISLENLTQSMLETIIPREKNSMVVCVAGRYRGKRGVMIDRDRKKQLCSFQVTDSNDVDCGQIFTASFDDVCEYVNYGS